MTRQMKLFHFPYHTGSHVSGWRHPQAWNNGLLDLNFYITLAKLAEKGKFDALFFADPGGFNYYRGREAYARIDASRPEPVTLLAALAGVSKNVGLVSTASTSNTTPYHLARQFASVDHLTGGRVGWNIVTSSQKTVARNYGAEDVADHEERYRRAREFVDIVKGLWDSFEDDAIEMDKKGGRYFNPDKLHALGHVGEFYKVSGPLDVPRPPQGYPVLVQAGGSDTGRKFAADIAEVVFTSHPSIDSARGYYSDVKKLAQEGGRPPEAIKILPAVHPTIGGTEAEALAKQKELDDLIPLPVALSLLESNLGGVDLSGYDLDGPLPDLAATNRIQGVQKRLQELGAMGATIRQIAHRHASKRTGHSIVGTPEQVVDRLTEWFNGGAADGFMVTAPYLPAGFETFVTEVVPLLQKRGLFRKDYEGPTLRENMGLERPKNMFVTDPSRHRDPEIW